MERQIDRAQIEKMANQAIAENNAAVKEIDRLQKLIEQTKKKKNLVFKELGITKEIQEKDISVSDLSPIERKIFDALQCEFVAEISARGTNLPMEDVRTKSKIGLSMARKRLKI